MGIPAAMSVNGFLASLPKPQKKKVWVVLDRNNVVIQYVGSTDNRKSTAEKYIDEKYPDRNDLFLKFSHFKGWM